MVNCTIQSGDHKPVSHIGAGIFVRLSPVSFLRDSAPSPDPAVGRFRNYAGLEHRHVEYVHEI